MMTEDDPITQVADGSSQVFERTPLLGRDYRRNYSQSLFAFDPWRRQCASAIILITLVLERLAFHAFAANLFLFLNKGTVTEDNTAWGGVEAMSAVLIFTGLSSLTSPFCGWLSDAFIGKFWTITMGLFLQIVGYSLAVVLAAHRLPGFICRSLDSNLTYDYLESRDPDIVYTNPCEGIVYVILILVGFGSSATKSCFAPFGAEQVTYGGYEQTRKFFMLYYWCVYIGCFIGVGALVWVEQNVDEGFFWAYLACTCSVFLALILFAKAGKPYYVISPVPGSLLSNIFAIMWNAITSRRNLNKVTRGGPPVRYSSWLDYAKMVCGGSFPESQVEDVKTLLKIIFVFLTLIPYWLVYFQMESTFQAQGVHMRIDLGSIVSPSNHTGPGHYSGFQLPLAWLSLFDVIALMILLPLLSSQKFSFSNSLGVMKWMLLRIPIGMFASAMAVVTAAVLEVYRRHLWLDKSTHITQIVSGTEYEAVDLSILWQIPQYTLIGIAEALASVASIEYAYHSAPKALQSVIMGLFCLIQGFGSFLGAGLVALLASFNWFKWDDSFHKDINSCSLHWYFVCLAGIQVIALFLYMLRVWRRREYYVAQD